MLMQREIEMRIGISVISEPYCIPDSVTWAGSMNGLAAIHWNYEYTDSPGIVTKKGQYCVAMKWKHYNIIACYISPNVDEEEFILLLEEIDTILREFNSKTTIIAGDFNAKDKYWGASCGDSRGERLTRWAASRDVRLINEGNAPTCIRHQGSSIVDLTWATADIMNKIIDWKVLDEFTYSDHAYIYYDIRNKLGINTKAKTVKYTRWSHKKMDVDMYKEVLEWSCIDMPQYTSAEEAARWLRETLTNACDAAMPRVKKATKTQVYWWNSVIADMRKACTLARRKWQRMKRNRNRIQEEIDNMELQYREVRHKLRKEINMSKSKAWEELVKSINDDPWGLPYKVVLNKLRRASPGITETLSIEVLHNTVDRLFPRDENWHIGRETYEETWNPDDDVTLAEVCNIMCKRMNVNKAPGMDGIRTVFLKRIPNSMIQKIIECLGLCLREGKFPREWKSALLILIPKGKLDVMNPKVRPICLLNEMGKLLERVITGRIESWLQSHPHSQLTVNQYGFRKARGTCDALNRVQEYVQEGMSKGEIVIGVSLDISNAFNSIRWKHIRKALKDKEIPAYIRKIIDDYLSERYIEYLTCNGEVERYKVTAGVPQGSVLGPTLWNIVYDWALRVPRERQCVIIGYADDTLILTRANNINEAVAITNLQISRIVTRIRELELKVAEAKTEIVIFANKRVWQKLDRIPPLRVGEEIIRDQQFMKYLGLYLDRHWTFDKHTEYIEEKTSRISQQLGRLMPNLHGPTEKKRQLYASTVNSVLMYGAAIWADEIAGSKKLRSKLIRVQRTLAIRVIAGYRTISADAALVMARIIPANIQSMYWRRVFLRIQDLKTNGVWEKKMEKEIKKDEIVITIRQWKITIEREEAYGKRTCAAISPVLRQWIDRKHGVMTYRLTQLMSGHGCFYTYLYRIGKVESPICPFCELENDSAEHTIQRCPEWKDEREELEGKIGLNLELPAIASKICEDEGAWKAFSKFAEKVMLSKEDDERIRQQRERQDMEEDE